MIIPASKNTSWLPGPGLAEEKPRRPQVLLELLPGVSLGSGNTGGMFVLEELHCWEVSPWSASF